MTLMSLALASCSFAPVGDLLVPRWLALAIMLSKKQMKFETICENWNSCLLLAWMLNWDIVIISDILPTWQIVRSQHVCYSYLKQTAIEFPCAVDLLFLGFVWTRGPFSAELKRPYRYIHILYIWYIYIYILSIPCFNTSNCHVFFAYPPIIPRGFLLKNHHSIAGPKHQGVARPWLQIRLCRTTSSWKMTRNCVFFLHGKCWFDQGKMLMLPGKMLILDDFRWEMHGHVQSRPFFQGKCWF